MPVEQRIQEGRRVLTNCLTDAKTRVDELEKLGQAVTYPPLLGPAEDWNGLRDTALHVLNTIQNHEGDYAGERAEDD